jgi:hypothetical protein
MLYTYSVTPCCGIYSGNCVLIQREISVERFRDEGGLLLANEGLQCNCGKVYGWEEMVSIGNHTN